ncbi:2-amino-4-hydroxy-6-hydroxymethyldihydropteridine diphosphokinase [Candidatus Laterigemmans baculatus]|uniref:2-amino-4-hydroxy-6- hydroxymethyldihydropteridine diphosphokinase n=1 Tax=Candidatus Laterigemmans baculatus TaxID=2770505 RepID=UPI0013DC11CF|nr:2-amino-4-hydroxy-6-hydroxymethyldihydropteridine diphosphokinase [Candidatus Laterigemmans baculatus]
MPHCLISFGSNLGDRFRRIAEAARQIARDPAVTSFIASRLFETPAIGGPRGQEPFLNGVARIETTATARGVLELLHRVETTLGRERAVRWDARSIDLDVVLYGDLLGNSATLLVPHPRYTARRFVLIPAAEVAGEWRDPRFGWTISELADHVSAGVPSIALVGGERQLRDELCHDLTRRFSILTFTDAREAITLDRPRPWVSSFTPPLPAKDSPQARAVETPRLVAHLQWTTPESRWPATHQIWQSGREWPEYRLEVDSPEWAVSELASALDSLGCPLHCVTEDGRWYETR